MPQPVLWRCPICAEALSLNEGSFICHNKHNFDRAKEGYVNLLVVNRKHSSDPGDNKAMLDSRRYFLQQGFYKPLAEQLGQLIESYLPPKDAMTVVDAGCGEGYYLHTLAEQLGTQHYYYGTDISRTAMRLAAKQYSTLNFAVASSFALPIANNSVDVVIRIFAPANEAEIQRILKTGGLYLWVYPAEKHLFELRQLIYDEPKPHIVETLEPIVGFNDLPDIKITYPLHLPNPTSIAALLTMTPYYWSANKAKQAYCQHLQTLDLTVDFAISIRQKVA